MSSVGINPPKTPVTKGSNGVAAATVPNICKMPGPPAPFVPTLLPNIGRSNMSPKGYSTTVLIEGQAVAIRGASFKSMGDIASQGTGGGIVSANVEGETKFISPGSLDVKIQGKNVHLLSDIMSNNNGPSGSPPNAATMAGVLQGPLLVAKSAVAGVTEQAQELCDAYCDCKASGTPTQACVHQKMRTKDQRRNWEDPLKTEVPFDMSKSPPEAFRSTQHPRPTRWWLRSGSRRPDAIVVNDVHGPWSGDNIRAVIECKWRGDSYGPGQRSAYMRIASGEGEDPLRGAERLIEMDDTPGSPNECRCPDQPDPEPEPVRVPVPVPGRERTRERQFQPDWRPVGTALACLGLLALGAAAVASAPVVATAAAGVAVLGLLGASAGGAGASGDVL